MSASYILTAAAEAYLRSVIRYTRQRWGDNQARRYIDDLTRGIERLARGEGPFKDMTSLHRGLRMARCEHHHIFCFACDDAPALVVAIFHERMDLMARLAARFE